MKKFQCHKIVKALKIASMDYMHVEDSHFYMLKDSEKETISVSLTWEGKHKPKIGGYLVEYEDGYQSYSPAQAFESGYSLIEDEDNVQ